METTIIISDRDPQNDSRSTQINDLCAALAMAQAEFKTANMGQINPYFKKRYEDQVDLVDASRQALTKQGLAVIQQILPTDDGNTILHTILTHKSGQWIESRMRVIPPKTDIQTVTSHMECLKRIAYKALVGVVASHEDDDGEMALISSREIYAKGPATKYNPKHSSLDVIDKTELAELEYELADQVMTGYLDDVLETYRIQSLSDLPKSEYRTVRDNLMRIKKVRKA